MDINFEYYKIFYYVAKYSNFTRAANALGNSLMDKFLKSRLSFFSNIISDILVSSKPAIADQIAEQMKATGTLEESFYLYPQLCLDIWLDALDTQ